jgi:cell division septal protein FtsQ
MSGVAAPADRRFRRAHVKPSRTRRGWVGRVGPTLRFMLAILVLTYGAYFGSSGVAHSNLLKVDRVVVHGNERLSDGEVLADLDGWRRRLLASPWVRDAALRRSFPSTVEVFMSERQPVGIGRLNADGMYLIDEGGVIIDQYGPQYADLDLPIVDGLQFSITPEGRVTDAPRAELAARVIDALKANADIAPRLSQVDVSDLRDAQVILAGDAAVISLGDDQFLARLQNYLELAPALRDRVAGIDHVDVRFENRIYVRPKKR